MATRGAICSLTQDKKGFRGVRHQRYSMPEALGKQLWDLYHGHFEKDLEKMLGFLINDHPGGWSSIVGADFSLPASYQMSKERFGPMCLCHGRLSAPDHPITAKSVFEFNLAWTYVFNVEARELGIVYNDLKSNLLAEKNTLILDLEGDEPDWKMIRCGKNFERCEHLAAEHFPKLANTPSGRIRTAAYIGAEPLTIGDVCAIVRDGYRYNLTGRTRGGNEAYHAYGILQGSSKEEQDLIIGSARSEYPGGYIPSERDVWVFPPTQDSKEEQLVDRATFLGMHKIAPKKKRIPDPLLVEVQDFPNSGKAVKAANPVPTIRLGDLELRVADEVAVV